MTLQQFRASHFFPSFKLAADLDPTFVYRCETAQADGRTFDVSVRFYDGVIDHVSLSILQPTRPRGDDYDYLHRNYLRHTLGYQPEGEYGVVAYEYDWGLAGVGTVKGDESEITIKYAA